MGEGCQELVGNAGQRPIHQWAWASGPSGSGSRDQDDADGLRFQSDAGILSVPERLQPERARTFARFPGLGRFGQDLGSCEVAREDGIWRMPSPGVYAVGTLFPVDRVYLDREKSGDPAGRASGPFADHSGALPLCQRPGSEDAHHLFLPHPGGRRIAHLFPGGSGDALEGASRFKGPGRNRR